MPNQLHVIKTTKELSVYEITSPGLLPNWVKGYVVSTPETRKICNDPFLTGIKYTNALRDACAKTLRELVAGNLLQLAEDDTTILHILRGGLNFGLREAAALAFDWNNHASAFISAQRARKSSKSEDWVITESEYKKIHLKKRNNIIFGDVVATGTSLEYALKRLNEAAEHGVSEIESLTFFTIGGTRSHEILGRVGNQLHDKFPDYKTSIVIYIEGVFAVAAPDTAMSIKISGTDLIRTKSILAPEFIESQYEYPTYPIERCTIYDAGSRAFDPDEYFADLEEYWNETLHLAKKGMTFEKLLAERFPELNANRFGKQDLVTLCQKQLQKIPARGNANLSPKNE